MRKVPAWMMILIPATLLLLLTATTLILVVTEDLPEHAQAAAIQTRFAEQVRVLRELAETLPLDTCAKKGPPPAEILRELVQTFPPDMSSPEVDPSPAESVAKIQALQVWKGHAVEHADLFSDLAILGAEMVFFCADGSTTSVGISALLGKEYHEPTLPLSRALLETPTEWPVVSLWYIRSRRMVRYEDRSQEPSGSAKGFRLILDLEGLEVSGTPTND